MGEEIGVRAETQDRPAEDSFSALAVMLFPDLPLPCLENLTLFAFSRSGIGQRLDLTLRERVVRAVAAHARHCHTRFDRLAPRHAPVSRRHSRHNLKEWRSQQEKWARELVEPEVTHLLESWARHGHPKPGTVRQP